jgi:hypothetical protein
MVLSQSEAAWSFPKLDIKPVDIVCSYLCAAIYFVSHSQVYKAIER